ncbi:Transposase type 1 [Trinorchestia longiramus]|nr:Transposase type 1 [Trinorchestia longiramus]
MSSGTNIFSVGGVDKKAEEMWSSMPEKVKQLYGERLFWRRVQVTKDYANVGVGCFLHSTATDSNSFGELVPIQDSCTAALHVGDEHHSITDEPLESISSYDPNRKIRWLLNGIKTSGRPCTSVCVENIDAVRDLIEKNRRITTESVADTLNISRIVTGDETWLYEYDPEDKTQSKQWLPRGGSGPVKAKSERSRGKVMTTVFWDAEGILLVDFLENKKTITAVYYEEILRKLSKKIAEKRPGKPHSAPSSTTTMHPRTALGRPELCYANFDGKSFDIHLITPT